MAQRIKKQNMGQGIENKRESIYAASGVSSLKGGRTLRQIVSPNVISIGTLTMERIKFYLESTNQGYFEDWAALCDAVLKGDSHLFSVLSSKKAQIINKPLIFEAQKTNIKDEDGKQQVDQISSLLAMFCSNMWKNLEKNTFLLDHLLTAILTGLEAVELVWAPSVISLDSLTKDSINIENKKIKVIQPQSFIPIPLKMLYVAEDMNIAYSQKYVTKDTTPEQLVGIESKENLVYLTGEQSTPGKYLVYSPSILSLFPHQDGLMRVAIFTIFQKKNAQAYWLSGAENAALPPLVVTVPVNTDEETINTMATSLEEIYGNTVLVVKEGVTVSPLLTQTTTSDWDKLVTSANAELSKLFLGSTMTNENTSGVGSYSMAKIHLQTRNELVAADAEKLSSLLTKQLFIPAVLKNIDVFAKALPELFPNINTQEENQKQEENVEQTQTKYDPENFLGILEREMLRVNKPSIENKTQTSRELLENIVLEKMPKIYFDGIIETPAIEEWHLEKGIVSTNEARADLGLAITAEESVLEESLSKPLNQDNESTPKEQENLVQ